MSEWILVKDKLPPVHFDVLVWCGKDKYHCDQYHIARIDKYGCWYNVDRFGGCNPISWRLLPGCYTITECEFVLVFKHKKKRTPKRYKTNVRQFFQEKPREHSRKPEYVQDMLDLMYPKAKKIELFARRSREGWDTWGNETTKFDQEETINEKHEALI